MTDPLPPRVCPSCGCRHLFVARRRWPWRRQQTWRCYGCFAVVDPTPPTTNDTPETTP